MKYVALLLVLLPARAIACDAPLFTLTGEMLRDPTQTEVVAYIMNEEIDDIWRCKADGGQANLSGRRYTIYNLTDPDQEEHNGNAIQSNWDDLWSFKVQADGETGSRRYTVSDISNPDMATENAFAIMENFWDLRKFKQDRQL